MTRNLLILLLLGLTSSSAAADTKAESFFDHRDWSVGTVPRGTTYHHSFVVTNTTDKPLRILSIRVSCGCVSATAVKKQLAPGEKTVVVAQIETRQFTGSITKTIFVLLDQPSFDEVRIHVEANVVPDLSISPASLKFGRIKKGTAPTQSVVVSFGANGMNPPEKAISESGFVQVKMEPVTGNSYLQSYRVTVSLAPELPVGNWHSTLRLASANQGQPPIAIPLTVEVVP